MQVHVIGFIPPVVGVDGTFNTIRLGQALCKRLQPDEEVFLMDEKTRTVFGRAVVIEVIKGELKQLCLLHGKSNHTEMATKLQDSLEGERLFALLQKVYGPHIATETKKSCAVYLRRIQDEFGTATLGQAATG